MPGGEGHRQGPDKSQISVKLARVAGFNSPDQMIKAPNYNSMIGVVNKKARAEVDRVKAETGRTISARKAIDNIYQRM